MDGRIGDCRHRVDGAAVNNCRAGTRTDDRQTLADRQILRVRRGGNNNRITRKRQRDGMPDSLASGRR